MDKSIRELNEEKELANLSSFAAFSSKSKGRERLLTPCLYRTCYQRDRDRITHSKSFRRLKHKTQVFILSPSQDHYRTRLTHALEVSQISRTIGRALRLNEDLIEAIALGHDVGHTPFGHSGEQVIRQLIGHFEHNEQSIKVVTILEKQGQGLNLTWEVRDGILNHTGLGKPATLEGQVVKLCDRVGYICHDIDDSLRAGILTIEQIPKEFIDFFGAEHSQMLTTMVSDIINNSLGADEIRMSPSVAEAMNNLREFMFTNVYHSPKLQKERDKAQRIISELYQCFLKDPQKLPPEFLKWSEQWGLSTAIVDYIASMTDNYAVNVFNEFFVPNPNNW